VYTGIWVNNNILSSTKFNSFLDNECSKLQVDQIVKRSPNSPVVLCENTNNEREEAYSHCMNFIQLQIKLYNITSHASYLLLCLLHCSDTSIKRVVLISRTYYRLICSYLLPFFFTKRFEMFFNTGFIINCIRHAHDQTAENRYQSCEHIYA